MFSIDTKPSNFLCSPGLTRAQLSSQLDGTLVTWWQYITVLSANDLSRIPSAASHPPESLRARPRCLVLSPIPSL